MSQAGVQPTDSPVRNSRRSSPRARFISSCTRASSWKGYQRVSIAMTFSFFLVSSDCPEPKTDFGLVKRDGEEPLRQIVENGATSPARRRGPRHARQAELETRERRGSGGPHAEERAAVALVPGSRLFDHVAAGSARGASFSTANPPHIDLLVTEQ